MVLVLVAGTTKANTLGLFALVPTNSVPWRGLGVGLKQGFAVIPRSANARKSESLA